MSLGEDSVDSFSTGDGEESQVQGDWEILLGITHSVILHRAVTPGGLLEQNKNLVGCLPRTI